MRLNKDIYINILLMFGLIFLIFTICLVIKNKNINSVSTSNLLRQQAIENAKKQGQNKYEFDWRGVLPPISQ